MGRGMHNLTKEQRTAIARKGGIALQASGKGYRWTKEQAIEAGKKGGLKRAENRRNRDASN